MTGGQGGDDEVLGSAEFFDLATQQWTMVIMMMVMMVRMIEDVVGQY